MPRPDFVYTCMLSFSLAWALACAARFTDGAMANGAFPYTRLPCLAAVPSRFRAAGSGEVAVLRDDILHTCMYLLWSSSVPGCPAFGNQAFGHRRQSHPTRLTGLGLALTFLAAGAKTAFGSLPEAATPSRITGLGRA